MIKAVIFDLDGVLVTTDDCHYRAWKRMADEEGIPFDRKINNRLRGVSRMESLEIILEKALKSYSTQEKTALAERKNAYYVDLISHLGQEAILPGAMATLHALRTKGVFLAIGSSSKNTPTILKQVGISDMFDAVADGNQIINSKPAPDVFLLAAEKLNLPPSACLVVEDADAGVEAALKAGMLVLAVGAAKEHPRAHLHAETLEDIDLPGWIERQQFSL